MTRIQQGAFSLSPDLTDAQIKKQIEYARHKYKTKCNCRKISIFVGPQYYSD